MADEAEMLKMSLDVWRQCEKGVEAATNETARDQSAMAGFWNARNIIPALLAEVERLRAREAAQMEIVRAVANSNPYGSWYPADALPPGVVCRWCMKRASSPKQCQHDQECTWRQARTLLASETGEQSQP